jgi:tRNA nucleotidyltransferase/poly(A) polymerase
LLSELQASGVLEIVDPELAIYRYQPKSDDLRCTIDQLADVYAKNLIAVTNLIHSNVNKKAQQFADAFIWRKDS